MDDVTLSGIAKSLDLLVMRQEFLAQNIANAGSENYQPVRVSFQDQLADAMAEGAESVRKVEPTITTAARDATDPDVRIDLELAQSAKTAMRYSALIEVLGRQMALSRAAIHGGQR